MNPRAGKTFGIHQQRGFWLRCFLKDAVKGLDFSRAASEIPRNSDHATQK
jgi:hypothetical protein